MIRVALLLPLLLAACAFRDPNPAPPPLARAGDAQSLEAACRREAERVVLFRDRGQQMRLDEGESRVGQQSAIPSVRAQNDNLARSVERERIARDCLRQSSPPAAARPAR